MSSPAFTLRGVRQEKAGVLVLDDISLQIPNGQITALIGPSGAGKSALLRLLNRLDDPCAGEIRYRDHPIAEIPVGMLRRRVGFVFQTPVVFPGTVRDNLDVAARITEVQAEEIAGRIVESLHLAELDSALADRDASRLSVGEKQRANIARALMTGPETLLMDEPMASLDPETAEKLGQTVARLSSERGLTVVVATHRLAEARAVSKHAVMLDEGRVVEAGPALELFEKSSHPRIRSFLKRVG
jgi:ABC-type methionine transport system ATPase subunit